MLGGGLAEARREPISERRSRRYLEMYFRPQQFRVVMWRVCDVGEGDLVAIMRGQGVGNYTI